MEAFMNIRMVLQPFLKGIYLIFINMLCIACKLIIHWIIHKCKSLTNKATIMASYIVGLIILVTGSTWVQEL